MVTGVDLAQSAVEVVVFDDLVWRYDCITAVGEAATTFKAGSLTERNQMLKGLGIDPTTGSWALGCYSERTREYVIVGTRGDLKADLRARCPKGH